MTVERELFELINNYRRQNGRAPLQWDSGLYYLCYEHSRNMANGVYGLGHDGVDGRYKRFPFQSKNFAENALYDFTNNLNITQSALNSWVNSQDHRENMLGNFNRSAIAGAKSADGKFYFTQLFGYQ